MTRAIVQGGMRYEDKTQDSAHGPDRKTLTFAPLSPRARTAAVRLGFALCPVCHFAMDRDAMPMACPICGKGQSRS